MFYLCFTKQFLLQFSLRYDIEMCFIRELKFLQRYDPYIIRQGLLISNIFSSLKALFFICFSTIFQLFRNAFKTYFVGIPFWRQYLNLNKMLRPNNKISIYMACRETTTQKKHQAKETLCKKNFSEFSEFVLLCSQWMCRCFVNECLVFKELNDY